MPLPNLESVTATTDLCAKSTHHWHFGTVAPAQPPLFSRPCSWVVGALILQFAPLNMKLPFPPPLPLLNGNGTQSVHFETAAEPRSWILLPDGRCPRGFLWLDRGGDVVFTRAELIFG